MDGPPDITVSALIAAFLLLAIPLSVNVLLKLSIGREILLAATRMTVQLFLAGLYLQYLFRWNHPLLNLAWLTIMLAAASGAVIRNSDLRLRTFFLPAFLALSIATLLIVLYFNTFVVRLDKLFDARFLVVIGGMLLGNSLSGNIVGATAFYNAVKESETRYLYHLAAGATPWEALKPFFRTSVVRSLKPTLATMMTIGIVSLPGMMTGQILGGSDPMLAIKYQITIMIAIFTSTTLGITLMLFLSSRACFDANGMLHTAKVFRSR